MSNPFAELATQCEAYKTALDNFVENFSANLDDMEKMRAKAIESGKEIGAFTKKMESLCESPVVAVRRALTSRKTAEPGPSGDV